MKLSALFLLLGSLVLLRAEPVATALKSGDQIPDVTLRTENDQPVQLRALVAEKPAVLIFYRGGWCPYCMKHLQALVEIEPDLLAAGVQIFAISMDQPAKLRETPNRDQLGYRLLSDHTAAAAKAFGIAYTVDDQMLAKLKSYSIDLEAASGEKHHMLPHPSVFVVGRDGTIHFAYTNTDYKVRLEPEKILAAAKHAGKSSQ